MKEYDVIVAGGGFSGIAAAIASARQGAKTLIIEKGNALGGAATNCLVNPFMFYWTHKDGEKYDLCRGIFSEIVEELKKISTIKPGEYDVYFHEEYLKVILNRMAAEAGVEMLFDTTIYDAETEGDKITSLSAFSCGNKIKLSAKCFIDATGDANIAHLSGCETHLGRPADNLCQPMTLCFRVANVDIEKFKETRTDLNKIYNEWQAAGKIKNIRENVLYFWNLVPGVIHFNTTRVIKLNPVDPFQKSRAEIEAREQVFELFAMLRECVNGFENSEIVMTAAEIGVRESRKIEGLYTLNEKDIVSCKVFEDSIAAGNYEIDIHSPDGKGTSHYYFKAGEYYTIPYRSLIPKGKSNLLVAGRCISATHEAQASIRIMPIVCCIGEAAGVAASQSCKQNKPVYDIDVPTLQKTLVDSGAIIK